MNAPEFVCWPNDIATATDVTHAALMEAGRPDLADAITGWWDADGFYVEVDEMILPDADWRLVDKAETLGRRAIGWPARIREVPS